VKRARAWVLSAIGLVLATPALALACPVCFSAKNEGARIAFLATTVFLTALPLLLIGGVITWLARRAAQADQPSEPPSLPYEED
jgi:high-affinity Fe2+/Pb2+ permease